ncbi:Cdc6-related protein, AAA superfamily ATPase [Natranaeroarchaeum sulfidigenes]|uniref:Cdc6-related protein, AAA superfamily ATPase n=1 Tax=Natranaeroarchaeum sulfidigenes TaxID=2784880 RepID=A0A897MHT8_9EURY|nr:Cdc6-related protein, AAA superfamily ATPase [Natranaeroarchaeum sulfidigenes]
MGSNAWKSDTRRLKNRIHNQKLWVRYILRTISYLEERGETPVYSKEIYDLHQNADAECEDDRLTTLKSI